jgi:hypothetical protein
LGLALGASEFALRANLAPRALELPDGDRLSLYGVNASFNYRFLPHAIVHPVAGIGLETVIATSERQAASHAFAATARAGLEFAYPLQSGGALALGIDATAHIPFAQADAFPLKLVAMLDFGAYLDYRF